MTSKCDWISVDSENRICFGGFELDKMPGPERVPDDPHRPEGAYSYALSLAMDTGTVVRALVFVAQEGSRPLLITRIWLDGVQQLVQALLVEWSSRVEHEGLLSSFVEVDFARTMQGSLEIELVGEAPGLRVSAVVGGGGPWLETEDPE